MAVNRSQWQVEEARIYRRDSLFLVLIIFVSIVIAEAYLLVGDEILLVDRIFGYLIVFIPLASVNLVAHYFYRNRRIRETGNLRTSLRYQMSLVFLLVLLFPAIPIFMISSNTVERLVEGFFGVETEKAMHSAKRLMQHYRNEEGRRFYTQLLRDYPDGFRSRRGDPELIRELFERELLETSRDYAALVRDGTILYETRSRFLRRGLPDFNEEREQPFLFYEQESVQYLVYRFELAPVDKEPQSYLLIVHRLHPGFEESWSHFNAVYEHYRVESVSRREVPQSLRLGLGLIYLSMLLFSLVMSLYLSRRISMPIASLAAAVRSVAEGKIDTRLEIRAQGEMGVLIDSFNQMTGELQSLRSRLLHSQRVAAWQEVARRLAHEIKNPLTPIQLSAERMLYRLEKPDRGDLRDLVHVGASTIVEQVTILKLLVEEFAHFARMPAARPQPTSLDAMVTEALNLFRGLGGVSMEMHLAGDLPPVLLDKTIMVGMINNLVKNSVEAIESVAAAKRERPGKIIITTALHRQGIRKLALLKIEDSGPGVEEPLRDRIFEPYFSTKGEHGTGLGLAMVERAVLEHDGRIALGRSSLGGAEFRILLPLAPQEDIRPQPELRSASQKSGVRRWRNLKE